MMDIQTLIFVLAVAKEIATILALLCIPVGVAVALVLLYIRRR